MFNVVIKSPSVDGGHHYRIPLRYVEDDEVAELKNKLDDSIDEQIAEEEEKIDEAALAAAQAEAAEREKVEAERLEREQLMAAATEKLKEAEASRQTAEGLIKEARLEGETIKNNVLLLAREEGEKIAADARATGFAEGYREGIAKAEAEGEKIRAIAQDVLRQAEESRKEMMESLEGKMIELSVEIAEKMIAAQLTLEPETVCNIAKEALSLVENRMLVVLYINPAELPLYENKMDELKSLLPLRAELQLITDADVQTGGCRIETDSGTVDTTLETRRDAIMVALYGE
ncbi:MAG: FliH/SctL family protein [Peptococcaceae bacterium]|nr:FliH/SctL family protein [Peptococcaceae bacterium]